MQSANTQLIKKRREDELVAAAVALLGQIIRILSPIPFFRTLLIGIVDRLLAPQERYHDHVSCPFLLTVASRSHVDSSAG